MKFTKMSLVAALLVGSSAFAIENTKVSGDAKLYYSTEDNGNNIDLFNKNGAAGQAAVSLSLTTDLVTGVSAGVKATALTTLGLQGQLVNNVWEATNGTTDSYIVNEAWLATTLGKTTGKIGRMELDTPLVFSETWSIVTNTFEAAVLINQDIPDTTLVGAYVGGSNGSLGTAMNTQAGGGIGGVIAATKNESTFGQFWKGAYAVGAINNSYKPLTVQGWYYQAPQVATAYWLQADLAVAEVPGLLAGIQYTGVQLDGFNLKSNDAVAVMVGYGMKDMFTAKLSYSKVGNKNGAGNFTTGAGFNLSGTGQSKLYTEAWWNYGFVTRGDTDAVNLTVEAPVADVADFGLYITSASQGASNTDMTEITVTASKTIGVLDATLAGIYVNTDTNGASGGVGYLQAYLTLNF